MRPTGLYGRKPALIPAGLRDLTYYAAGALPKPPPSVTVPDVPTWGMLGNDQYGDCGVAGLEHGQMAMASILNLNGFTAPGAQQAVQYYLGYTGGQDSGVVLSDFLRYVQGQSQGFYGELVEAYAPVTVQDIPTLQFAISAYGFAYTGISVTQGMEDAFGSGQPWDMSAVQGSSLGGHCIPLVGYDSQYLYAVTWGEVQAIAYPAWHQVAEEAWAVISGYAKAAGSDGRGISYASMEADIARLSS
jgi:hypothetical protein